jgi:hypothetical protein
LWDDVCVDLGEGEGRRGVWRLRAMLHSLGFSVVGVKPWVCGVASHMRTAAAADAGTAAAAACR